MVSDKQTEPDGYSRPHNIVSDDLKVFQNGLKCRNDITLFYNALDRRKNYVQYYPDFLNILLNTNNKAVLDLLIKRHDIINILKDWLRLMLPLNKTITLKILNVLGSLAWDIESLRVCKLGSVVKKIPQISDCPDIQKKSLLLMEKWTQLINESSKQASSKEIKGVGFTHSHEYFHLGISDTRHYDSSAISQSDSSDRNEPAIPIPIQHSTNEIENRCSKDAQSTNDENDRKGQRKVRFADEEFLCTIHYFVSEEKDDTAHQGFHNKNDDIAEEVPWQTPKKLMFPEDYLLVIEDRDHINTPESTSVYKKIDTVKENHRGTRTSLLQRNRGNIENPVMENIKMSDSLSSFLTDLYKKKNN